MPKISPGIPNELLFAHVGDREKLSDALWIIASQVAMLLARSVDQLDEDRKIGNPPPAMKPWGVKGPVRYKLGSVRDFMFGNASEEYNNTEHARQGIALRELTGLTCFEDFLSVGQAQDVWPVTIHRGIPVDFFRSLGLGEALTDDDTCEWMTLERYLNLRISAATIGAPKLQNEAAIVCPNDAARKDVAPERSELTEVELSTLASFFSSGTALSTKIYVAGDRPFPGRGKYVLRLVQKALEHLGFDGSTSTTLVSTKAYSRVEFVSVTLLEPFHVMLASARPSSYLWYCEQWSPALERATLEAAKRQLANDTTGLTTVPAEHTVEGWVYSDVGFLVEALAHQASSSDNDLMEEVFPGLKNAVQLIGHRNYCEALDTLEVDGNVAKANVTTLYSFLKASDTGGAALPPLILSY